MDDGVIAKHQVPDADDEHRKQKHVGLDRRRARSVSLSELNDVSSELFVVFRLCEETRYTTQDFLILIAY